MLLHSAAYLLFQVAKLGGSEASWPVCVTTRTSGSLSTCVVCQKFPFSTFSVSCSSVSRALSANCSSTLISSTSFLACSYQCLNTSTKATLVDKAHRLIPSAAMLSAPFVYMTVIQKREKYSCHLALRPAGPQEMSTASFCNAF